MAQISSSAARKEPVDDRELLAGRRLVDGLEPEPLGHDRERVQRPLLQRRVVVLRLLQGERGARAPRSPGSPGPRSTLAPLRGEDRRRARGRPTASRRARLSWDVWRRPAGRLPPPSVIGVRWWERASDSGPATMTQSGPSLCEPVEPIKLYLYYSTQIVREKSAPRVTRAEQA